jgi:hypothetical protein
MAKKAEDKAPEAPATDLASEFADLGRAMRDALNAAWNSEERRQLQSEIRSGLNQLADEMEAAAKKIRDSEAGQQVEAKAKQAHEDIQAGKVGDEMRGALGSALRAARDAIDKVADSFTPMEESGVEFDPIDMEKAKGKDKAK